jgi:hypothetical protein
MRFRRSDAVAMGRALARQDHMKALHRDMGGGLRWGAIGQFAPNPIYGMHPANVMQIPPMSGSGGYTNPPNASTPPTAIMMAAQPHASGGGTSFADRIEAADAPSANVESSPATSALDLLVGAMKAYGVDPLRLSRFGNQPPATNPLAQSAHDYVEAQSPAWYRRPLSNLGLSDPDEVTPRAKGGNVKEEPDVTDEAKRLLVLWKRIERESPNVDADKRFSYVAQRSPGIRRLLRKMLAAGGSRSGARAQIQGCLIQWSEGR